ncbi:MAG: hypothetical protein ACI9M1_000917 [Porticoccaceae bacterium]|jgi:hypothetical protein
MKKIYPLFFLLFFYSISFFAATISLSPENYYWVGGSGNWSDTSSHWATSSGGSDFYLRGPSAIDNVIFDINSFDGPNQTVTLNGANPTCKDMTWSDLATVSPTFNSNNIALNVYGSLTLSPDMILSKLPSINFLANTTGQTISFSGKTLGNLLFNEVGGGWTFQDEANAGYVILTNGTLNTNNNTCNFAGLQSTNNNVRSLDLGTSVMNFSSGPAMLITNTTNLIFSGNNSTINITGDGAFSTVGLSFDAINFTSPNLGLDLNYGPYIANTMTFNHNVRYFRGNNTIGTLTVNGTFTGMNGSSTIETATFKGSSSFLESNTFGTLNLTGAAGTTYTFGSGSTQTINTALNVEPGNCRAMINVNSTATGNQATLNIPSGTTTLDYVNLKDINAQGGATFLANNAIDFGNNTGWSLSTSPSKNYYWVGGSGNWSNENHWAITSGGTPSGCAPTPADNVIFDSSSFSSTDQTITLDGMTPTCKDMTWSDLATVSPTFNSNNIALNIYGSLTLSPDMILSKLPSINFLANTTGQTISFSGKTLGNLLFNEVGGGWTFQDEANAGYVILTNGTLNTNNNTCNFAGLQSTNNNVRSLDLGTSVMNFSSGPAMLITNTTNLIFSGNNSTINITGDGAFSTVGLSFDAINFTSPNLGLDLNYGPYIANTMTFNHNVRYFRGNNTIGTLTVNGTFTGMNGSSTIETATFKGSSSFLESNTFGTLNLTGAAGTTYTFGSGSTQTIDNFLNIENGTSSDPTNMKSSSAGTQAIISMATGSICTDFIHIQDINAIGGGSFNAGPNSQDISNNNGWSFLTGLSPTVTITSENGTNSICGLGNTLLFSQEDGTGSWSSSNTNVASIDLNGLLTAASAGTTIVSYNLTSSSGCVYKDTKSITINITDAPTVIPQIFCELAVVGDLIATGTEVKWYETAEGSALTNDVALTNGSYFVSQTENGCESNRVEFLVTINQTAIPTVSSQIFCNSAAVGDLSAIGTAIRWYKTAEGAALANDAALTSGSYFVSQTENGCESSRAEFLVTINQTAIPTVSSQIFCNGAVVGDLSAIGTAIRWCKTAEGAALANDAALTSGSYFVSQTENGCESSRVEFLVTINQTAIPTVSSQIFCNSAVVGNLSAIGTAIRWYKTAEGAALANDAALTSGSYFVSQTENGCESSRAEFLVTINQILRPTAPLNQTFESSSPKIKDIVIEGTHISWYASKSDALNNTNALDPETIILDGTTYYATQTVSDCTSTEVATVNVTINKLKVDSFNKSELKYYPNPVSNNLIINNSYTVDSVRALNIEGQVFLESHPNTADTTLDMTVLPIGIYIIEIKSNNQIETFKVLKK